MYDEKTPTVRHGMHSTAQRWAVNTRVGFCFALLGGLDRMRVRVHRAACRAAPAPPTKMCAPEQERGTVQLCEAAAKSATAMRVLWTFRSQVSAAVYSAVGPGGLAQSARADWRCARADQVTSAERVRLAFPSSTGRYRYCRVQSEYPGGCCTAELVHHSSQCVHSRPFRSRLFG
jgi:hypothetical protein